MDAGSCVEDHSVNQWTASVSSRPSSANNPPPRSQPTATPSPAGADPPPVVGVPLVTIVDADVVMASAAVDTTASSVVAPLIATPMLPIPIDLLYDAESVAETVVDIEYAQLIQRIHPTHWTTGHRFDDIDFNRVAVWPPVDMDLSVADRHILTAPIVVYHPPRSYGSEDDEPEQTIQCETFFYELFAVPFIPFRLPLDGGGYGEWVVRTEEVKERTGGEYVKEHHSTAWESMKHDQRRVLDLFDR